MSPFVDVTNAGYSTRFTKGFLDEMVHVGDAVADEAMRMLNEAAYNPDGGQLEQLRHAFDDGDERAEAFFARGRERPAWLNKDSVRHGQRIASALTLPYGISLMHSLYAGALFPRATLVTGATGRLGSDPSRRIHETGAFIAAILQPGGLDEGSLGFDTAIRVRLLHGSIRAWTTKSASFTDNYVGVPIDQTMLAMTNGLFSYLNVRSLGRLGCKLSSDDVEAHHHMWRYVGYLLGIDERLLPETPAVEAELWSALVAHQAMPDVLGPTYLDSAAGSIGSVLGGSQRKTAEARTLMLYLSGPAWFGLDEPVPKSAAIVAIRGLGAVLGGAYRVVPGAGDFLVSHGRRRLGAGVATARRHGYGMEVERNDDDKTDRVFEAMSDGVRRHFADPTTQLGVKHQAAPMNVRAIDRAALQSVRWLAQRPRLAAAMLGRTRRGNPFGGDIADPYAKHELLRAEGPLAWNPWFQQWYATGYDAARDILASPNVTVAGQPALFLACKPHSAMSDVSKRLVSKFLLFIDPPDHTRLRRLVGAAFSPKQVARMEEATQRRAESLLAAIADDPRPDVFVAFNAPLPIYVIAELLGIPEADFELTRELSDTLTAFLNPMPDFDPDEVDRILNEGFEYFDRLIEERLARPTDDLISAMVHGDDADDRLDRLEIVALAMFLMFAGHETTSGLLGTAMVALARFPDQRRLLAERPDLWPNAVEEFLRYDTALQLDPKTAAVDFQVGDQHIKAGQNIIVMLGAANRDPNRWKDPDVLRVDREDARSLAFGHGIHHCLGAALARLEIRVGLRAFLDAFGEYTIDPSLVEWKQHMVLRGPTKLPVTRPASSHIPGPLCVVD
jgi:pimeloyl-[acyl-carrier protein] synthase